MDKDFNPKRHFVNKRFRKTWRWIHGHPNNNENVIFPTKKLILAKTTSNDYFVFQDVYNKILQYRQKIESQKQLKKKNLLQSNNPTKLVRQRIRPTPIVKSKKSK